MRVLWTRVAARLDPAKALANATQQGIAVHLLGQPGYPVELGGDHEAPSVCFTLGDASRLSSPVRVAVIGTRSATAPGLAMAKRLGHDLAEAGVSVVSGLARGIDGAAHLGALHANGCAAHRRRRQRPRRPLPEGERGAVVCRRGPGRPVVRGAARRASVRLAVPRARIA